MSHDQRLRTIRHSAAHLLAHAVKELFPDTLLTIGPPTHSGFFYDFLPRTNFKDEDLPNIEERMHDIVARDLPLTHTQIPKDEAKKLYADNPYKLELIEQIPGPTVGIARQGDFFDLCKGDHVASTKELKHFKLLHISGSYWRADRNKQPLQRITGTAFETAKELRAYERRIQEAKKYDHRTLGKQLDLFSFLPEGPGFPFFHAKGQRVLKTLKETVQKELDELDYQEISTPMMLSQDLWKQSGHYDHYKDNMFFSEIDKRTYAIKPMNCPGAILIYKERPRSYKELPLRYAEFGQVHRYELSGVLHGLFRVRAFTQDDGHIFCTKAQINEEVFQTLLSIKRVLAYFGFEDIQVALSTRPDNAMGSVTLWDEATEALKQALERAHIKYTVQEGEGAFYGPKIEFGIQDSLGRSWQCSTIQLDFFLPQNFDLHYIAPSGEKEQPVMIHRAIYGSLERFFGILVEHFKGKLPFWLAPIQISVLTITDEQKAYAQSLVEKLKAQGIRTIMDESSDPISGKIKSAQLAKIPWMLIIGQKEQKQNTVTLRYSNAKQEADLSVAALLEKAEQYNQEKLL